VMEYGGFLKPEEQSDLASRLNGRWERNIVKEVREIVRDSNTSEVEKVVLLKDFVAATGLPIPTPPEALPPVALEDIRVLAWMAVSRDAPSIS